MTEPNRPSEGHRIGRLRGFATIAVLGAVLFVSLIVARPAAPPKVVLLTGPEGTAYHVMGERLAEALADLGLDAEVRVTRGGLDNVEQLAAGIPDAIALAPSEVENLLGGSTDTGPLVSLGSIAWEPVWLFHRSEIDIQRIPDLAGLRVATGAKGTVVDDLGRRLLEANGIADEVVLLPSEGQTPAAVIRALLDGEIDAAFATGGPHAPAIEEALRAETVEVLSFERAEAYQARNPTLARIVVPEGALDLARNHPAEDLVLISSATNLVTRDTLYPGTVPLLLRAAGRLQGEKVFVTAGERFPTDGHTSLPVMPAATRYYQSGERGLGQHLPYKVTRWLNHLGFFVLPLLAAALLLLKAVPLGLKVWGNMRLVGLLKRLEAVEKAHASGEDRSKLLSDLDRIDQKSAALFVPRSTVHDYIDFRQFLHDMRERIERE